MNKAVLRERYIYFPIFLADISKKKNLSLNEFFLLTYFWDEGNVLFDINVISKALKISTNEIMDSFNSLLSKNLISLETKKDDYGKICEFVSLENLYIIIESFYNDEEKKKEESDIYSIFERELGSISSYEYEIIRAWIEKGYSEELVLGALKEAVYNGVRSLRYIDKILYEWQRKGYKNMKEVNQNNRRFQTESKELFDYNWLDDNE